jgi:hypothetical protein
MHKEVTDTRYKVGSNVRIIDKAHKYADKEGIINRLGTAGDILFIHVALQGIQTIIAFVERQVECIN